MVKYIFTIILLSVLALGDILDTIKTFVDPPTYRAKENLIKVLFSKPDNFIDTRTGKYDTVKITQTLKNNGLLSLSYRSAQTLNITFNLNEKPLLLMKIINDTLESMGYTYYLTDNMQRNGDSVQWSININTQNIVDPVLFKKKLKQRNCTISAIEKNNQFSWVYKVEAQNAKLKTTPLPLGIKKDLGKPHKAYWIDTQGARNIQIQAHPKDDWFPKVTFFDKNLVPLNETSMDKKQKSLRLSIPTNASYIRIEDKFLLDNIKRGLIVKLLQ